MNKKILFITGTRADFGKLKPLMKKVEGSTEFGCFIFSTGMHTLSRYGSTHNEIEKSGFKNLFPYINQMDNTGQEMDMVLANTIQGIGHYVREYQPDLIVVHGDRIEALAGAIVGTLNNILVTHIEGGELSGTVDELIRHAVSKLSHIHCVANEEARTRLIQMGETPDSVFVIGSPDVDIMLSDNLPTISEVKERYEIDFEEYLIFVYHPVTTALHKLMKNIDTVVGSLLEAKMNLIVIYPNNDRGSDIILESLKRFEHCPWAKMFSSLRFEYFLMLLKHAKAIVGNSSVGIREAPIYGVPTINIGDRQMNRYQYPSIINVQEDKQEILHALRNIPQRALPSYHFGQGNSTEAFLRLLRNPQLWERSCQKQFQSFQSPFPQGEYRQIDNIV